MAVSIFKPAGRAVTSAPVCRGESVQTCAKPGGHGLIFCADSDIENRKATITNNRLPVEASETQFSDLSAKNRFRILPE